MVLPWPGERKQECGQKSVGTRTCLYLFVHPKKTPTASCASLSLLGMSFGGVALELTLDFQHLAQANLMKKV